METPKSGFYCVVLILLVSWLLMNSDVVLCQTIVKSLPGYDGLLPFSFETGYIGVEGDELQLFYYFLESENKPKEDPLIFWMTGGPHCSGMSTILYEIGPLQFDATTYNGGLPRLLLREYSWTKTANILLADFPVGTGFSYATTAQANFSGDIKASYTVNEFLRKWLVKHKRFISNPLYVGGESYSGFILPLYFERMVNGNEEGIKPNLNLKGYLLGNPATDPSIDGNSQIPFAHRMGLVSDELFHSLERSCKGDYRNFDLNNNKCSVQLLRYQSDVRGICISHVLENYCESNYVRVDKSLKRRAMSENTIKLYFAKEHGAFSCRKDTYKLALYWMNDKRVREALHVNKENAVKWIRCNYAFDYLYEGPNSIKYHARLSARGFRSLIYSGDHDMIVPFIGTQTWIKSLNYSIRDDWRKWVVDGQIAGYTRTYSNDMTFATIKGGGHTAPEYKPKECATMFKRWIVGDSL